MSQKLIKQAQMNKNKSCVPNPSFFHNNFIKLISSNCKESQKYSSHVCCSLNDVIVPDAANAALQFDNVMYHNILQDKNVLLSSTLDANNSALKSFIGSDSEMNVNDIPLTKLDNSAMCIPLMSVSNNLANATFCDMFMKPCRVKFNDMKEMNHALSVSKMFTNSEVSSQHENVNLDTIDSHTCFIGCNNSNFDYNGLKNETNFPATEFNPLHGMKFCDVPPISQTSLLWDGSSYHHPKNVDYNSEPLPEIITCDSPIKYYNESELTLYSNRFEHDSVKQIKPQNFDSFCNKEMYSHNLHFTVDVDDLVPIEKENKKAIIEPVRVYSYCNVYEGINGKFSYAISTSNIVSFNNKIQMNSTHSKVPISISIPLHTIINHKRLKMKFKCNALVKPNYIASECPSSISVSETSSSSHISKMCDQKFHNFNQSIKTCTRSSKIENHFNIYKHFSSEHDHVEQTCDMFIDSAVSDVNSKPKQEMLDSASPQSLSMNKSKIVAMNFQNVVSDKDAHNSCLPGIHKVVSFSIASEKIIESNAIHTKDFVVPLDVISSKIQYAINAVQKGGHPNTSLVCKLCSYSTSIQKNFAVHLLMHIIKLENLSDSLSISLFVSNDESLSKIYPEVRSSGLHCLEKLSDQPTTTKGIPPNCEWNVQSIKDEKCIFDSQLYFTSVPKSVSSSFCLESENDNYNELYVSKHTSYPVSSSFKIFISNFTKVSKSSISCPHCSFIALCPDNLVIHMKIHSDITEHYAGDCGHLQTAKVKPLLKCYKCDFYTYITSSLTNHRNEHLNEHKNSVSTVENKCKKKTSNFNLHFENLLLQPELEKNVVICCHLCSYNAASVNYLMQHIDKYHRNDKLLHCRLCSSFSTLSYDKYAEHMSTCHVDHEVQCFYECPHCPYCCNDANSYANHVKLHKKDSPLECLFCSFTSADETAYCEHIHFHSTNLFVCDLCGFRTPYEATYKNHMNNHQTKKTVLLSTQELFIQNILSVPTASA